MRYFWSDQSGNVTLLAAFGLPVLALAAGLAIDQSTLLRTHDDLQNLADAAALAGARAMGSSQDTSEEDREELASESAEDMIVARRPSLTHLITPSDSDATVEVSLSIEQAVAFGRFLGQEERTVQVSATATYMGQQPSGCLIAIDETEPSGIYMQGAARIRAPGCGVWSNAEGASSIRMQGSPSLLGEKVCADDASGNAEQRIQPELSDDCGKAIDPYRSRLEDTPTSCDHTNFEIDRRATSVELNPGVYCGGLEVAGLEVRLRPGLYVIKDGPLTIRSNGELTGSGVSIVLTGDDASLDMQGSGGLTLSAMTTGDLAGIAFAVTDTGAEGDSSSLQGSPNVSVSGSIYMPGQRLHMQGNPGLTISGDESKILARSFELRGSPQIQIDASDTLLSMADVSFLRVME